MNCGKACAIFEQLESDKYSENEKLTATEKGKAKVVSIKGISRRR